MRLRRILCAAMLPLVSLFWSLSSSAAAGATLDSAEQDLVTRINDFRAGRGLPTVTVSDPLTVAAKWMSADMSVHNYFAHTSLDGRAPVQRMNDAGYPAFQSYTGEDLAAGYTSTADVLAGWIASPAHYAVLVNPAYRVIGVGRSYGAGTAYGWYWTADFGSTVDAGAAAASFDQGYHSRWNGQSPDPTIAPGATTTLVVAFANAGYRGWYTGVPNQQASLGTSAPLDGPRADQDFPMVAARERVKGRGQEDRLRALDRQITEQLREAQVIADSQPDRQWANLADHRFAAARH